MNINSILLIACTLPFTLVSSPLLANENVIEPSMVTIPAGEFLMGNDKGRKNERPVHKVKIASFNLSKYEVTVKEYRQFINATGYISGGDNPNNCYVWRDQKEEGRGSITMADNAWNNSNVAPSDFHPVLCVSPTDAKAYIQWLNKETKKHYRLASEAEWEYAARAGSKSDYFFGDNTEDLCEYGNVFDQRGQLAFKEKYGLEGTFARCDDKSEFTSVVGMYRPNAFGLFDIIGNVGEIVADCEHNNYQGAPSDGSAWTTQCDKFRGKYIMNIRRGGAYGLWAKPKDLRSSNRHHVGLNLKSSLGEGFRLALNVDKDTDITPSIATEQFNKALSKAQNAEAIKRQALASFPNKPSGVNIVKNKETGSYQLSWQKNNTSLPTTFNIYRSASIGGEYTQIKAGVKAISFIDNPAPTSRYSYVVTAAQENRESTFSAPVLTDNIVNRVKTRIEAEHYNEMQGIKIGVVRKNEEAEGGFNLTGDGGINTGNWVDYIIEVNKDGYYQLDYRVASAEGSNGFELLLNDNVAAKFAVPTTGGWRKWQTVSGEKIFIKAGQYKMRIKAIGSGWKLNWFTLMSSNLV